MRKIPRAVQVVAVAYVVFASSLTLYGGERNLDPRMHHVRSGGEREWSEFPAVAEAAELVVEFESEAVERETTLRVRHRDVKQNWTVRLNERDLGKLPVDENSMVTFYAVPGGTLRRGLNRLRVFATGNTSDDCLIGDVRLEDRPRQAVLTDAAADIVVRDADGRSIPARITIVDDAGSLVTTGNVSNAELAVRPGIVYSSTGNARVSLPAGKYSIYAGHGFEYSLARSTVELTRGQSRRIELEIHREVDTVGYAACDTHVHTLTYSRHGDATIEERMTTLAAEGVEIPVATDHNVQIDYRRPAAQAGVTRRFTPIVGNEVTTGLGHFNVFPLDPTTPPIDHLANDWPTIFDAIDAAKPRVVILNHARDVHNRFRPFDPEHHIGIAGQRLDGRSLRVNAMELVNSGTTQTDPLQLPFDWFGLLNRGYRITPVGASDSHDVGRHFVGQGRTYVRCDDSDPGAIDLEQVYRSFAEGRVAVSYGLLVDLTIDGKFRPGDLASASRSLDVEVIVRGPAWTRAEKVVLYQNGVAIRESDIASDSIGRAKGEHWRGGWSVERPKHDVFFSVIATGPGVTELYWPTPKPYQPKSPDWKPYGISVTGAIWFDADGDGRFTCAHDYAKRLFAEAKGDAKALAAALGDYDEAVAVQAASFWAERNSPLDQGLANALAEAAVQTRRGFALYTEAWQRSQEARVGK